MNQKEIDEFKSLITPDISYYLPPHISKENLYDTLSNCITRQVPFQDIEFTPNKTSLVGTDVPEEYDGEWDKLLWRRPSDVFEKPFTLWGSIYACPIKQGSLGDAYLLCALSSLAENPKFVAQLFPIKVKNDYGLYGVWLN